MHDELRFEPMNTSNEAILLVEDNEDDVFALRRAFKKAEVTNPLKVATDGEVMHLATPLRFRVAPHPLLLLRPAERREDPG